MKKLLTLFLVVLLTFSVLVACSSGEADNDNDSDTPAAGDALQDGKYLVKYEVSSHGNYPMATMEVQDGEIVDFNYQEYLAEPGEAKNADNYDYEATLQTVEAINTAMNESGNPEDADFDAISGATHTKASAKEAADKLMKMAKNGETYEAIYADGTYEAKAEEASHGWLPQIIVVVKDGQVVGVDYDEIAVADAEGEKAIFDEEGKPVMDGENVATEPVQIKEGDEKSLDNYKYYQSPQAIVALEYQIINNNGTDNLDYDVVSGATHTKDNIKVLAEEALSEAK